MHYADYSLLRPHTFQLCKHDKVTTIVNPIIERLEQMEVGVRGGDNNNYIDAQPVMVLHKNKNRT